MANERERDAMSDIMRAEQWLESHQFEKFNFGNIAKWLMEYAEAENAELARRVQELEAEWVSVEDRLPETDGVVLVSHVFAGDGVLSQVVNGVYVWFAKYDGKRWLRGDGYMTPEQFCAKVTHWRPLPLPPKATEAKQSEALRTTLEKIAFDPRDPEDEPGNGNALFAAWEWKQWARKALAATEGK